MQIESVSADYTILFTARDVTGLVQEVPCSSSYALSVSF